MACKMLLLLMREIKMRDGQTSDAWPVVLWNLYIIKRTSPQNCFTVTLVTLIRLEASSVFWVCLNLRSRAPNITPLIMFKQRQLVRQLVSVVRWSGLL